MIYERVQSDKPVKAISIRAVRLLSAAWLADAEAAHFSDHSLLRPSANWQAQALPHRSMMRQEGEPQSLELGIALQALPRVSPQTACLSSARPVQRFRKALLTV